MVHVLLHNFTSSSSNCFLLLLLSFLVQAINESFGVVASFSTYNSYIVYRMHMGLSRLISYARKYRSEVARRLFGFFGNDYGLNLEEIRNIL